MTLIVANRRPRSSTSLPTSDRAVAEVEVRRGDTLGHLLLKVNPGLSRDKLMSLLNETAALNGLGDPNLIEPGQRLRIPLVSAPAQSDSVELRFLDGSSVQTRFTTARGADPHVSPVTAARIPREAAVTDPATPPSNAALDVASGTGTTKKGFFGRLFGWAFRFLGKGLESLLSGGTSRSSAPPSPSTEAPAVNSPPASSPLPLTSETPASSGADLVSSAVGSSSSASAAKTEIQLPVPWYSQFHSGHGFTPGDTSCFKAAVAMARDSGATVLGPDHRIQVATSEDSKGLLKVDSAKAREGIQYIDSELDSGRPVVVGVSYKDSDYNIDYITDHFITVTGRQIDQDGLVYYPFLDPGTTHPSRNQGRLYVDEQTGKLYNPGRMGSGYAAQRYYEVSMVRRNA